MSNIVLNVLKPKNFQAELIDEKFESMLELAYDNILLDFIRQER